MNQNIFNIASGSQGMEEKRGRHQKLKNNVSCLRFWTFKKLIRAEITPKLICWNKRWDDDQLLSCSLFEVSVFFLLVSVLLHIISLNSFLFNLSFPVWSNFLNVASICKIRYSFNKKTSFKNSPVLCSNFCKLL